MCIVRWWHKKIVHGHHGQCSAQEFGFEGEQLSGGALQVCRGEHPLIMWKCGCFSRTEWLL